MFSKQKRLSGRDITQLFESGKTLGTPFFVARFIAGPRTGFSVIAPKNLIKSAYSRNLARRKWYASLRTAAPANLYKSGLYAIVLRKEGLTLDPEGRSNAIKAFISKLK